MRNLILKVAIAALFIWMMLVQSGTSVRGISECPEEDCNFYESVCLEGGGTFDGDCDEDENGCSYCEFTCYYENVWGFGLCWE